MLVEGNKCKHKPTVLILNKFTRKQHKQQHLIAIQTYNWQWKTNCQTVNFAPEVGPRPRYTLRPSRHVDEQMVEPFWSNSLRIYSCTLICVYIYIYILYEIIPVNYMNLINVVNVWICYYIHTLCWSILYNIRPPVSFRCQDQYFWTSLYKSGFSNLLGPCWQLSKEWMVAGEQKGTWPVWVWGFIWFHCPILCHESWFQCKWRWNCKLYL